jgi:hypothetical protein
MVPVTADRFRAFNVNQGPAAYASPSHRQLDVGGMGLLPPPESRHQNRDGGVAPIKELECLAEERTEGESVEGISSGV